MAYQYRSSRFPPEVVADILSPHACSFLVHLHDKFDVKRKKLLEARSKADKEMRSHGGYRLLDETREIRESAWQVAPTPKLLLDRRVEITGPAEPKMMINALNSGAKVFMADLEDALCPTWENVLLAQRSLYDAVEEKLKYRVQEGPKKETKLYTLLAHTATLMVRPRGWHLQEKNFLVRGEPISGSLFDFGLFFYRNAVECVKRDKGPYFYLPKMESHLEAKLWAEVFADAEEQLGIEHGKIRATVLIETLPAAFQMDEILFQLKDYSAGLNAGRWDYLFSAIKKYGYDSKCVFPDRSELTMEVPFMRAYCERLVDTCHARGTHAMGGMSAFIPSRRDAKVNEKALAMVRADKEREISQGFDGTWVAHPDLVPVAKEIFDRVLGESPHQRQKTNGARKLPVDALHPFPFKGGKRTLSGLRSNISVALLYSAHWLEGRGAVAIQNLMEDAATAEISRSELWQWVNAGTTVDGLGQLSRESFTKVLNEEMSAIRRDLPTPSLEVAGAILKEMVFTERCPDFFTVLAYEILCTTNINGGEGTWNSG